ncbi:MAG TPA: hypothetical protein VIW03_03995, partial [Anaeromyxobacter sp.]
MSVRAFLAVGLLFTSAPLAAAAADPAPLFGIARLPSIVAAGVLILWLTAVVAYFVWAIRRYNENYGLTDAEWKVLYPGLYASEKERPQYERLHEDYVASRLAGGAGEDRAAVLAPLAAPRKNPYGRDSFGLPPGTVRGALALTAAVMFIAIEIVNLFEPDTETRFAQLVTAFQMVLAFYFGSRAVEVLQAAQRSPAAKEGVAGRASPSVEAAQPAAREPVPARGVTAPAISAPAEQAVMPASQRPFRLDSIVTVAAKALLPARV